MDAAEAARDVNSRIGRLGRRFGSELSLSFLCECGCFERVVLTADGYDEAKGAWAPGHRERLERADDATRVALRESFRALDAIERAEALLEDTAALRAEAKQIARRKDDTQPADDDARPPSVDEPPA